MADITKDMTIGEILEPIGCSTYFIKCRNALLRMSFRTGRNSGRSSNGAWHGCRCTDERNSGIIILHLIS